MTKRKYKEERIKLLRKYSLPMSEIPDKSLKDRNGCWIWLKDLIDYRRQSQNGFNLTQNEVEYRNLINTSVDELKKEEG